jgi:superfamily II DNA or RNA helicase
LTGSALPSPEQLQQTFGDRLFNAAQQLGAAGSVIDVRILQTGRVVTGVVSVDERTGQRAGRHRVYIQYQSGQMQSECSCGERSPCLHIAAVSIAATQGASRASANTLLPTSSSARIANPWAQGAQGQRQHLFYLCEASRIAAAGALRLSVWVGEIPSGGERPQPQNICAFAPRLALGNDELPRYVAAQDAQILRSLTARDADGPWALSGGAGADVLRQVVATGRAFWQTLQSRPLQSGATRTAQFAWQPLQNGEQRLACLDTDVNVLIDLEPPLYIDAATCESGTLALPCSSDLLRRYRTRSVAPEQVLQLNEEVAREADGAAFPRLRILQLRSQACSRLHARLQLCAGPDANLHFVYDGIAVSSRSLQPDQDRARLLNPASDGSEVWEFERDRDTERQLQTQLERVLPNALQGADAWLGFMLDAVPALQADGWEIFSDAEFPYRLVRADDWFADLATHRDDQWFDLRLGVSVEGRSVNLLPALVNYLQKMPDGNDTYCRVGEHLLVRLDDGRYLPVAIERVQRIADTLVELLEQNSLNKRQALSLPLSHASRLTQLTQVLHGPALQSDDQALLTRVRDLQGFAGIEPLPAPPGFLATLRHYQQEGLGWLQFLRRCQFGGILADDMGLGKTVQTIAHLLFEKQQGRLNGPSLIVAPVSVIGNWQQELRTFAPSLKVLTLHGSRRKELFHAIGRTDVVITGYPSLQLDSEALLAHEFSFIILDEAQMIKNPRAKVSQMARALRAQHRLCLTGTPMENHLGELWSLFDFLQPGLLGNEKHFQRLYRTPIEKNGDQPRAEALTRRIAPFVLRRTKDAVAKELPAKTQIVESIVLDEQQRDFYDGIRLAMHQRVREAIEQQGLARSHITVLDALLKLRQACCDPRLVSADAQTRAIPSAKLEWLLTVLPELAAEGRRILLFSQFTAMLRLIEAAVQELSIPYCLLTGETQQRAGVVRQFQSGAAPLFLISLKAGGTGLNLTAADTVIHYDPWWNPAAEAQATDRAHRIGQQQPVFVYKLIAQNTVEEKILQLQADKRALATQLHAAANSSPVQLSASDLQALFAP